MSSGNQQLIYETYSICFRIPTVSMTKELQDVLQQYTVLQHQKNRYFPKHTVQDSVGEMRPGKYRQNI